MNKQEIQHRIKRYELVRECAEENLNELNTQLAEAEKPKLGHGDFGITDSPYIVVNQPNCISGSPKAIFADGGGQDNADKVMPSDSRLGNVFDLMKGWDKPFKEWGDDRASKGIKIVGNRIEFYACTSGCCSKYHNPCLENAEEFHKALGHAIADLKRKQ